MEFRKDRKPQKNLRRYHASIWAAGVGLFLPRRASQSRISPCRVGLSEADAQTISRGFPKHNVRLRMVSEFTHASLILFINKVNRL